MSFLDKYLEGKQLPALDPAIKDRLDKIEESLNTQTGGQFSGLIQAYADRILKIVEEIRTQFKDWKPTAGNFVSAFRFIIDIANEVAVIIKELSAKIIPPGMSEEDAHKAKILFGQELTYFIYLFWDPRLVKWVPTWVEKKLVYFVAGMVIDWALDYLESKKPDVFALRCQSVGALVGSH